MLGLTGDKRLTSDKRLTGDKRLTSDKRLTGDERLTGDKRLTSDQRLTSERRTSDQRPATRIYASYFLNNNAPFVPPKPNEFDSAYSIFIVRFLFGT